MMKDLFCFPKKKHNTTLFTKIFQEPFICSILLKPLKSSCDKKDKFTPIIEQEIVFKKDKATLHVISKRCEDSKLFQLN